MNPRRLELRGTCEAVSKKMASEDPSLTVVRGWYVDVFWGEQEQAFQFTDHTASTAKNLEAIAYGVVYAGLADKFSGDNYPVPEPIKSDHDLKSDDS